MLKLYISFVFVVLFDLVNVSLFKSYNHSEVDIGGSVILSCPSNRGGPVRWLFVNSENALQRVIFNGRSVESDYIGRVFVDPINRDNKLLFHNIQASDFGWYICIGDGDLQPVRLTEKGYLFFLPN